MKRISCLPFPPYRPTLSFVFHQISGAGQRAGHSALLTVHLSHLPFLNVFIRILWSPCALSTDPFLWVLCISRRRWGDLLDPPRRPSLHHHEPRLAVVPNLNLNNSSQCKLSQKCFFKSDGQRRKHMKKLGFKAKLRVCRIKPGFHFLSVWSSHLGSQEFSCDGLVSRVTWMPRYETTWVQWDLIRINISGIFNILICFLRLDFILSDISVHLNLVFCTCVVWLYHRLLWKFSVVCLSTLWCT